GISGANVHVIENWAPLDEVRPQPKANAWAREHGVDEKFCFMYSGTLGMKHRPEIVIAGGAGFDWLRKNADEVSPDVLKLLPFQPYERLLEVMASADTLLTLLDSEAGAFAVPSKTLAYLCAGRSLIIGAPRTNEAAQVVLRADAGIVVSPDDSAEIIHAAERLLIEPGLCARFGANARAYAERAFAIDAIASRFLAIFGCPVEHGESSPPFLR